MDAHDALAELRARLSRAYDEARRNVHAPREHLRLGLRIEAGGVVNEIELECDFCGQIRSEGSVLVEVRGQHHTDPEPSRILLALARRAAVDPRTTRLVADTNTDASAAEVCSVPGGITPEAAAELIVRCVQRVAFTEAAIRRYLAWFRHATNGASDARLEATADELHAELEDIGLRLGLERDYGPVHGWTADATLPVA